MTSERLCRAKHCPTCFSEVEHLEKALNVLGEQRDKLFTRCAELTAYVDTLIAQAKEMEGQVAAANRQSREFRQQLLELREFFQDKAAHFSAILDSTDKQTCSCPFNECSQVKEHQSWCELKRNLPSRR